MEKLVVRCASVLVGLALLGFGGPCLASPASRSPASRDPVRYRIEVRLEGERASDPIEYCFPLSEREYRELSFHETEVARKYADRARRRHARSRGYYRSLYGPFAAQIVRMKVRSVVVRDVKTQRVKPLRRA